LLAGILPLEPPCQPCFVLGVFRIWSWDLFARHWLQAAILLIFASLVARITGSSQTSSLLLVSFKKTKWRGNDTVCFLRQIIKNWGNAFVMDEKFSYKNLKVILLGI
jgi:hypothetical protein